MGAIKEGAQHQLWLFEHTWTYVHLYLWTHVSSHICKLYIYTCQKLLRTTQISPLDKWVSTVWCIPVVECYSPIKGNGAVIHVTIRLVRYIPSEWGQKTKSASGIISFTWNVNFGSKGKIYGDRKQVGVSGVRGVEAGERKLQVFGFLH